LFLSFVANQYVMASDSAAAAFPRESIVHVLSPAPTARSKSGSTTGDSGCQILFYHFIIGAMQPP